MSLHRITANFSPAGGIRHEQFEGRDHLVVPVVMICEGVLNGALVPLAEFSRFPEAWNGLPVPVLHPEEQGQAISANRPDVIERNTIGTVFNARTEGAKLKAELWLDTEKACRLGFCDLMKRLEAGECIEVSTGYFADDDPQAGEFNGRPYSMIHRNIRPDHLALLPGQIGACSIADGCGTRTNSKKGPLAMKVNEAWVVMGKALGLNTNCQCEDEDKGMDISKQAEALVKANALDAKQLAAIQGMSPEDRAVMAAFVEALGKSTAAPDAMEGDDPAPDAPADDKPAPFADKAAKPATNGRIAVNAADLNKLIANGVQEHLRRHDVAARLKANAANKLTDAQIAAMPVEQLEAVEQMIRPADYSGQGGFAANSDAIETNVTPLTPRGVLGGKKKEA